MTATIVVMNRSNGHDDNNNGEEDEYGERLTLNISDGQQLKQQQYWCVYFFIYLFIYF